MASIPPGDPHRDITHPSEPGEPRGRRAGGDRGGPVLALTILAVLIVVVIIVLL
jgi:hypothetical protein